MKYLFLPILKPGSTTLHSFPVDWIWLGGDWEVTVTLHQAVFAVQGGAECLWC